MFKGYLRTNSDVQPFFVAIAIFSFALVVYGSNSGYLYTFDSAPNSVLLLNFFQHHALNFDAFRKSYYYNLGAGYVFIEAPNGHLTSIFPIGTAILSAPIYLFFYLRQMSHGVQIDVTSPGFEALRLHYEKQAACIIGAVAAALFFLCARRLGNNFQALLATIAFAFGTEMWTIGSQALWQHGSVNLVTLATIYALLRSMDTQNERVRGAWGVAAGVGAGFLPVVRPTSAAFSLAMLGFMAWTHRKSLAAFVIGGIVGVLPGLIWNLAFFRSIIGGYEVNAHSYVWTAAQLGQGAPALLVSPSKGLLVYTPFLIFSGIGAVCALQSARFGAGDARLLAALTGASLLELPPSNRTRGV